MNEKLNMYMGYSRSEGSQEGAILIFDYTAKEARKNSWNYNGWHLADGYIDYAVRRIWDSDWLYEEADQEKLKAGIPHVVDNPKSCKGCELWGVSPLDDNGYCEQCGYFEEYMERSNEIDAPHSP